MTRRTDLDLDMEERCRLLDDWVDTRRQIAALEAHASDLLIGRIAVHDADVAESPFHRDAIYRSMIAEYAAAGHIPRATVEHAFTDARTLSRDLPAVRAAFQAGTITVGHVREIVQASMVVSEAVLNNVVDAETLGLYEQSVLVVAEQDTAARTRAHARKVAAALAKQTVVERHRRATDERCVSVRSVDDGLALLTAVLPEWLAVAIADRLTRMAREIVRSRNDREPVLPPLEPSAPDDEFARDLLPGDPRLDADQGQNIIHGEDGTYTTDPLAGLVDPLTDPSSPDIEHAIADERTLDQIRADLLTDLLLASAPSETLGTGLDAVQARIQVTVAATTLTGTDDRPAELDGHGPLHPDIARGLAGRNTGWSRLFLDPTGLVTETDTYTPTAPMRRFLRARDQHCRFPGCRMPTHRCDIDHTHDHARGGRTRTDNLSHLCRTHHTLKHPDIDDPYRWTAHQHPGGDLTWTSPLGRTYTDPPRRRVMFT
ncbi:HNH endonuclease signature motif containing protein [Microbacterium sp. GCS4]|uniref:HNH endonuclease signature motif containing protein n=1 Tax=Microbacterium sp. GCS4 TaxID=1692239 RepID=UPI00067FBAEE|nr:HNH endonuclease signature motif containing protein [Microbacterium sp. GCS4]KNY04332.1 hypothetical protein AKH00_15655 [Microbacterium sp. GCS4]